MSYTDRLMSTGERIVTRDRQHWFVVLASGRYGVAAIGGAILLLIVQGVSNATGGASSVLGAAAAILLIGGLIVLAWEVLRYQNQQYIITNRRVIQVSGVINKHSGDSSLEKINDADLSQSLLGRMFNFGDLDVLTASDAGIDRFRMIHDPVAFKRAMLDAKHEYEQDMARGPMPVSPPLRTTPEPRPVERVVPADPDATSAHAVVAPPSGPHGDPRPSDWPSEGQASRSHAPAGHAAPGAAAPAPAAAPAAPTPPRMTPDEVTRTLASLADLRDRGALSAEEFEHKKADLLGRL
jgi:hypothetical protein